MGQYLPRMMPDTPFRSHPNWRGLHAHLDPILWLSYATGSFTSTPALRPVMAFMPRSASRAASESLLHRDSAAALVSAERYLSAGEDQAMADGRADRAAPGVRASHSQPTRFCPCSLLSAGCLCT
jgi:hypothetical protein